MKRLSVAILSLAFALGLASAAAAQPFIDSFYVPSGSSSGSPQVGEPFQPGSEPGERLLRDQKKKTDLVGYVAGRAECGNSLGHLRAVRANAIRQVEDGVSIAPVCARRNLMDQQKGVASIRVAVSQNAAMTTALRRAGYGAADVVGVALDGRGATLYVKAR